MSRDTTWRPRTKKGKVRFKMTPEQIKKRNESRRRNNPNWFSDETRAKISQGNARRKITPTMKKNMTEAQLRRWRGEQALSERAKLARKARRRREKMTPAEREARSYRMKIWWANRKKELAAES